MPSLSSPFWNGALVPWSGTYFAASSGYKMPLSLSYPLLNCSLILSTVVSDLFRSCLLMFTLGLLTQSSKALHFCPACFLPFFPYGSHSTIIPTVLLAVVGQRCLPEHRPNDRKNRLWESEKQNKTRKNFRTHSAKEVVPPLPSWSTRMTTVISYLVSLSAPPTNSQRDL